VRYVVTGGAGFIGSVISRTLLEKGNSVVIVDKLDSLLYPSYVKKSRLEILKAQYTFDFHELDLATKNVAEVIQPNDIVIHCAALPGQVLSWENFNAYSNANILATKNLLDACVSRKVQNFVYSSTSSVYGKEANPKLNFQLEPHSPYGVTKLAGENLARCYNSNFGLSTKILRYFSVYGPGQRSDMAIQIFLESIRDNKEIVISGNGEQSRDFTYVEDCARATISAAQSNAPFLITDVSGGEVATILEVLKICFEVSGRRVPVRFMSRVRGDQDTTLARSLDSRLSFGSDQTTKLLEGIKNQWFRVISEKAT
jgi:UDP-glucuronate 4-epimerase